MNEQELMLTAVRDCRRVDLFAHPVELQAQQKQRYNQMRTRRAAGEPLQYVIGETSFMGISLRVDKRVLIPRPETEILVELALEHLAGHQEALSILDIGTGSGNIAIALAKNIRNVYVTAVDISQEALTVASANARANNVQEKISFIHADMEKYLQEAVGHGKKFDMIISNPPYIPTADLVQLPSDVKQEPRLALDGGDDGLRFYRTILETGPRVLNPASLLAMELGDGQSEAIKMMFAQHREYSHVKFYKDYVGTDRIVIGVVNYEKINY